jgi:3-hydroxybutyryl-CoA dehydratase
LRRLAELSRLLRDYHASDGGAGASGAAASIAVATTSRRSVAPSTAAPLAGNGDGGDGGGGSNGGGGQTTTTTTAWTVSRAFSQADVDAFVLLTGDANPIHRAAGGGDAEAAANNAAAVPEPPPPPPLVPGLLLASLFPAIIGSRFSGAVYARQSLRFRAPARVGEAVVAVVSLAEQGDRGRDGGKGGGGGGGVVAASLPPPPPPPSSSRVAFDTVVRRAADGRVLVEGTALAIIPLGAQMRAREGGLRADQEQVEDARR